MTASAARCAGWSGAAARAVNECRWRAGGAAVSLRRRGRPIGHEEAGLVTARFEGPGSGSGAVGGDRVASAGGQRISQVHAGRKRGARPTPRIRVLAGPLVGRWRRLEGLQQAECLCFDRSAARGVGDGAQRACGVGVAGGTCATNRHVVIQVFGDGVVGRPPGAGNGCDGGRGRPQFDDAGGAFTAVPCGGGVTGRVDLEQGVGEGADLYASNL